MGVTESNSEHLLLVPDIVSNRNGLAAQVLL